MLNKTSIEEANKHLQALYSRVSELENVVEEQRSSLVSKDSFIQTKVKELSQQDLVIEDLQQKLEKKERDLIETNASVSRLQEELSAKNLQISTLKQKSKMLSDLVNLLPDLRSYMSKVENIAVKYHELDSADGYVEVKESPIDSDDTENSEGGVLNVYAKPNDVNENMTEYSGSIVEMARNFSRLDGTKSFSVTEDQTEDGESSARRNSSPTKELYF